jgi:MYXO-CTERM domain-containing protein
VTAGSGGAATGGSGGTVPGSGGAKASGSDDDGGCGCRATNAGCAGGLGLLTLLAFGALLRRAKKRD